ncbi:MAG: TetR/AcrR family transcriptional regulator [Pseudomonadales bacterium]|jgi:AcrR family transcriptional regulator|nr:TetR/AcrR family transcriptional regulator [Pseudomonadales bacterium]MDP6471152.1 TetR/AcrR family transcriptional regulator [Pseudomonadales bacterium]MDP6825661.1 TetR/AcrR family transcriptional regulator [Pseudomonadales bacterium]MDP6971630.1 TetR/AcrR family transcriptional regulator [Pseudomonadales bacterium]|tara:strand:+ start:783 stop:1451 length:669 start_codon:yes stop_codon:yes gene_type:complete
MRSTYHHGDLAVALLDAGDELLKERGLPGFTLRECARRAGVSHAAPKHHFGGVRGLLTAIAARGFERLTRELRLRLEQAGDDLHSQFLATSTAYYAFAQRYSEHFRIMFRGDLLDDSDDLKSAALETFTVLTNVIRRQRGEPERDAPYLDEDAGRGIGSGKQVLDDILIGWCHIHGYAHLRLEGQFFMINENQHHEMLDTAAKRLSDLMQRDDESGGETDER